MSIIETVTDVNNTFLSRRELTCNFAGLGGKLKNLEAADMITREFNLDGKVVIPMRLQTQVGKSLITGTFYVYEDEGLAKKHINPTIFSRLEKTKAKIAEAAAKEAEAKEAAAKEAESKEAEAKEAAAKEAESKEAEAKEAAAKEAESKEPESKVAESSDKGAEEQSKKEEKTE